MNVSKKLFASVLCLSFLMNFQSAKAGLSLGGLFLNGIGLCCDVGAYLCLNEDFINNKLVIWLVESAIEQKAEKSVEIVEIAEKAKMGLKKLGARSFNRGVIFLCLGLGCHALGTWLMWRKSGKKPQDAKLTDGHVRKYQDDDEATLQRLLKKQPD